MNKKDYIAFAAMLQAYDVFIKAGTSHITAFTYLRSDIANYFQEDNENFDRSTFISNCGY